MRQTDMGVQLNRIEQKLDRLLAPGNRKGGGMANRRGFLKSLLLGGAGFLAASPMTQAGAGVDEMQRKYAALPTFEYRGFIFHDHVPPCSCGNCPPGGTPVVTLNLWHQDQHFYRAYGSIFNREDAAEIILKKHVHTLPNLPGLPGQDPEAPVVITKVKPKEKRRRKPKVKKA